MASRESPRRGSNFVTNKVVKSAVRIKKGLDKKLLLGNLDSYRDWGHSKDYVRAMHMILNHIKPDDFVCATGITNSVRDMCNYVFSRLELNYKDFVHQDKKFLRSEELKYLRGDSSKLRNTLGWEPKYTFEMLMDEMIEQVAPTNVSLDDLEELINSLNPDELAELAECDPDVSICRLL